MRGSILYAADPVALVELYGIWRTGATISACQDGHRLPGRSVIGKREHWERYDGDGANMKRRSAENNSHMKVDSLHHTSGWNTGEYAA
eukprot:gene16439-biopygen12299